MELEIFDALTAANVPADKARAAAASVKKEIDERYTLHLVQLATKGDLAEMKNRLLRAMNEMQRWALGSIFAAVALFAAVTKILH